MLLYLFLILLVSANSAYAQPVTLNQVLAEFTSSSSSTLRLGSDTNYYQLQFLPPPTQTLALNTTTFTPMTFGTIRVTRAGSPLPIANIAPFVFLRLYYSSVQYGIQTVYLQLDMLPNGKFGIRASGYSIYHQINDAHFSLPGDVVVVDDSAAYPADVDIAGQGTRGRAQFVTTPTITLSQGTSATATANIQTVGNSPFAGTFNGLVTTAPTSTPGEVSITVTLSAYYYYRPGTYTVYATIRIPGVPDSNLPFTMVVTPNPARISLSNTNIVFAHVKGSTQPPPVTFTVSTSNSVFVNVGLFDNSWINLDFSFNGSYLSMAGSQRTFVVTPNMANKNLGFHSTRIPISTPDGTSYVNVSFYVADAPGSLKTSSSPAGGGTVEVSGAVQNGQPITMTARAAPGFTFARWIGTVSSIDNPLTFVVNGTTNIVAEFAPANSSCTYTISPLRIPIPAGGDVGRIDVRTQPNCSWTFSGLPSWMSAIGALSGTGSGALSYTAAANPQSSLRQATLLAGGFTIAVEQAGSGCANVSAASPPPFAASGGNAAIAVNGAADCVFVPIPIDSWLTSTSPDPFQQNSSVVATAAASNLAAPRTTALYLGGFRLPVLQKGTQFSTVFPDVTSSNPFADYISVLERSGIADLCGEGFCPDAPTTRAQMAEFLVHSLLRSADFTFSATPYFTDVSTTHSHFKWIQKLYELGVTTGCGGGAYCPNDSVTRGQMATFLIRARARINNGAAFPFRATPYFTDVPSGHGFFPFVQKLRDWGITAGCGATTFCPDAIVSRGQMAVFLVRSFLTP